MKPYSKIFVAGYTGLVGQACLRALQKKGYSHIITRTHHHLDLSRQQATYDFFEKEKPEYVFLAAAKVGGIWANQTYPAEFIFQNLAIQTHVLHAAWLTGVKRLLFLGSSCIYPRDCPQPIKEEYLLTGPLEPTNEPYAIAKIAGIKMAQAYNRQYKTQFLCVMPTNLYGPEDHFDPETSHVIPALIRKIHEAKVGKAPFVTLWGSGKPRREFLHVDDLAEASVFLMEQEFDGFKNLLINIGTGTDMTIAELAETISEIVSYQGEIRYDSTKPDGTPQKLLDISRITALGWKPKIPLKEGLKETYEYFKKNR